MGTNKKLNRREALKLLGTAAGASLLAGLPAKWSKPSVTSGHLPAHAQISGLTFVSGIFVWKGSTAFSPQKAHNPYKVSAPSLTGGVQFIGDHEVIISQPVADVQVHLDTSSSKEPFWNQSAMGSNTKPDGDYFTFINTKVIPNVGLVIAAHLNVIYTAPIDFTWTFVNSSDGTDTKTFTLKLEDGDSVP